MIQQLVNWSKDNALYVKLKKLIKNLNEYENLREFKSYV